MYFIVISTALDNKLKRLVRKNRKQYDIILNKVEEIIQNPHRYKNLRSPMQHLKRVHIDKHFVLTFSIDEGDHSVIFIDFEHHDKIYKH